ncbi:MAG: hypothetical protein RLZZ591_2238 [Pseudomonadota bacterium]
MFPGYESLFLARERGLLNPADIRLIELHSNTDTLRALAADQLEVGCLTLDEALSARADGVDLRVILVMDESAGADVVMSRQALPGLSALRGKRIALEEGAVGGVMLAALLRAADLSAKDVVQVATTLDQTAVLFAKGEVDAVVTTEPWASQIEAAGGLRIFDSASIPGRILDVLAVRAGAVSTYGSELRQLVSAHFRAWALLASEPKLASQLMAPRLQVEPADVVPAFRGLKLPDVRTNIDMLAPNGSLFRTVDELQTVMLRDGLLSRRLQRSDLIDGSFLQVASS